MSFFLVPREEPKHCSKPCRFFRSCLRVPLTHRHARPLSSDRDSEDSEDDHDQMVTLTVRDYAKEAKMRRPPRFVVTQSFNSIVSPMAGELLIAAAATDKATKHLAPSEQAEEDEESEAFLSAGSRCSSASIDAFFSVGSRCSSVKSKVEVLGCWDFPQRSIFEELSHCEGWPFGLYRKALLLPPLPKSPTESWTWRKSTGTKTRKMS